MRPLDDQRAVELDRLADEYLRRLRAGDRPSVAEYAAAHPHLAERIRATFPAVDVAERAMKKACVGRKPDV